MLAFITLLPTLIHLALSVLAVLLSHNFLWQRATDILCATQALNRVGLNVAQHNQCVGLIWRARGIACVVIVLVMVLIAGGLVVLTVVLVDQLAGLAQFAAPSQPCNSGSRW